MRMAMGNAQLAMTGAFVYEEASPTVRPEREQSNVESLFAEPVIPALGGQRAALRWSSEYRLLLAVLQDAVACWFRYCRSRDGRDRRMFQEVYEWFWDKENEWLYAFESICEYLELDPDAIRRGLLRWQATPMQQPLSVFQMRRVRRHRKIRPLYDSDEDSEW